MGDYLNDNSADYIPNSNVNNADSETPNFDYTSNYNYDSNSNLAPATSAKPATTATTTTATSKPTVQHEF